VVDRRVEDLDDDRAAADVGRAERREVDVREGRAGLEGRDRGGLGVDELGELLGRRPAVVAVELDPKVLVEPARVVRGREDEGAKRNKPARAVAHDGGDGGGGEQAVLADPEARDAVRRADLQDRLDRLLVEEAAVARDDERAALVRGPVRVQRVKRGLDKVV
jgi:hypothetical protein